MVTQESWLYLPTLKGACPPQEHRFEKMNGNNRQLHDLAWNQQYVVEEGLGTIR
jgi:hypothetical protein